MPYAWNTLDNYIEQLGLAKIEILGQLSSTIETQLTKPMTELAGLLKNVRSRIGKREHKLIDYDRHRLELEGLRKKSKEKGASSNIDKKIIKQEQTFEKANQDFRTLNELLKKELPLLINSASKMILPAFQSIYRLQQAFIVKNTELLKLLCPRVESKANIMRNFDRKKEVYTKILAECALLSDNNLSNFSLIIYCVAFSDGKLNEEKSDKDSMEEISRKLEHSEIVPILQQQQVKSMSIHKEEFVVALYDYNGADDGDLSFVQNETIKVLDKDESGWWKGTLKGNVGVFPSKIYFDLF